MPSGDSIFADGTSGPDAGSSRDVNWFGYTARHCYRKYIMVDAATAAENGVYVHTGGADYLKWDVQLKGATAPTRLWEQVASDNQLPAASSEIHQVGSNITADSSVTVTEPSEWSKAEISAHTVGASGVTVLMEAHYIHGRP